MAARVSLQIPQAPGSAQGEADQKHAEDRQPGLRRGEVLEWIRGNGARVVGRDLGERADGVDTRAPLLREFRACSPELIRPGRAFVGSEVRHGEDREEPDGEGQEDARGQAAHQEEPEPELGVEHQDVAVEEQRMSGAQGEEHGQPPEVSGEDGAALARAPLSS